VCSPSTYCPLLPGPPGSLTGRGREGDTVVYSSTTHAALRLALDLGQTQGGQSVENTGETVGDRIKWGNPTQRCAILRAGLAKFLLLIGRESPRVYADRGVCTEATRARKSASMSIRMIPRVTVTSRHAVNLLEAGTEPVHAVARMRTNWSGILRIKPGFSSTGTGLRTPCFREGPPYVNSATRSGAPHRRALYTRNFATRVEISREVFLNCTK